jgi:hypothetical protein
MIGNEYGQNTTDLSDDVIKRLEDLKQQRNLPRAELLREAVEQYPKDKLTPLFPMRWGFGKAVRKMELNSKETREEWQ